MLFPTLKMVMPLFGSLLFLSWRKMVVPKGYFHQFREGVTVLMRGCSGYEHCAGAGHSQPITGRQRMRPRRVSSRGFESQHST